MTSKPCQICGEPSNDTRCAEHQWTGQPSPERRGYDWTWRRLATRAKKLQPFCSDCGTSNDLQVDHSPEAWRRKNAGQPVRLTDIAVVCGHCNRRRGAARGWGATPRTSETPPMGSLNSDHTPTHCSSGGEF